MTSHVIFLCSFFKICLTMMPHAYCIFVYCKLEDGYISKTLCCVLNLFFFYIFLPYIFLSPIFLLYFELLFTCIWYFIRTNISAPAAPKCPKWPHQTALLPRCAPIYNTLWAIHAKYCKNYNIFSFLKLAGFNVFYNLWYKRTTEYGSEASHFISTFFFTV